MKVVFDTNVLISAFMMQGHCTELYEHIVRHHELILSVGILQEFDVIVRKKFDFTQVESQNLSAFIQKYAQVISGVVAPKKQISRDSKDDHILAAAFLAKSHVVISGDKDLLVLKSFRGIPIITPREFWKFEGKQQ